MIETAVQRLIFMSRWLMAPIYLGLIVVLGVLVVTFLEELIHFVPHVFELYRGGHEQALWNRHAPAWLRLALDHLSRAG